MQLAGNTFIVTGGSSGLGGGCVTLFAEKGAHVVIADVNEEAGEAAASADNVSFIKTDVRDEAQVKAAVELATSVGTLRGVVNCAGIAIGKRTVNRDGTPHDLESFSRVININLIGSFNMLRMAASAMSSNEPLEYGERGVIINTASVAGYEGQIGQIAYAASKGGIMGMTLPAARDLSAIGVRVVTIAPGIFGTPMLGGMPENVQEALAKAVPFPKRLGTPADYAALAEHVVTNTMLNGETIRLDGAIRMGPR